MDTTKQRLALQQQQLATATTIFKQQHQQFETTKNRLQQLQRNYAEPYERVLQLVGRIEATAIAEAQLDFELRPSYVSDNRAGHIKLLKVDLRQVGVWLTYLQRAVYYNTYLPYSYFESSQQHVETAHYEWSVRKIEQLRQQRNVAAQRRRQQIRQAIYSVQQKQQQVVQQDNTQHEDIS